ncbi:putative Endonuclease-reverse transcriptase-containing protein 8, partial [Homarus americanus]
MLINVDVLRSDKLIELNAQLKEMENTPQEVKPKHYRYERITAEYNLEGYDIIEQNLLNKEGRGISPNSDESNNTNLLQLMQEVNDKNVLYKIIVGDFNLPQIYWSNYTSVMGLNDVGTMFIEKVRVCFLTQHIEEITRIRDSTGNTLDLLFSNEESIVGDIKLESPLGKSDHACMVFIFIVTYRRWKTKVKKRAYVYEKADYLLTKQRLTMDRIQYLSLIPDIESKWNKFKRKFQAVIDECVPKKIIRGLRLWTKVKKKQSLWERLKIMKTKFNERACTREMYLETEKEYRRLNNQVRWETRNILKRKEQETAKNVKANPKVFWKYVQTKTRTKARIADLYKDEEKVQKTVNDQEKADVLSEQFSQVFIKEPDRGIPTANKKEVPALQHLEITEGKIRKVIQKLKRQKSPSPDGLHPRVIKEMMEELFQPLRVLFESSFREGNIPEDWRIAVGSLRKTTVEKDIGVVTDDKLTFFDHLAEKINKANKIVGIIRRTFVHLDAPIFKALRHSFPSRVVNNWNGLPEWVVNVETVEKFEAKLDKYWKNQQQ